MDTLQTGLTVDASLEKIVDTLRDDGNRADFYARLASKRRATEPSINAFEQSSDTCPTDAKGPFHGLPITVKDQIAVAGWPRWFGLEKTTKRKEKTSAPFIQTLQDLGCVVQGKTALPPYALDLQTFNARRGPTQNPYAHGFTVGGSSGGGAAAVASGMSLLDIGADLGGSLRVPAVWCGVTSLVPTEGRFESSGMLPKQHKVDHFARMGPIARTASDLGFFWETLTGEVGASPAPQNVRLSLWSQTNAAPIEPQIARLWSNVAATLKTQGFQVDATEMPDLFSPEARRVFGEVMGYEASATLPFFVRWMLRRDADAIARSPNFLKYVYRGYYRDRKRHDANLVQLARLRHDMLAKFETCDALVLPVVGIAAFRHVAPIKEVGGVRTYAKTFETMAGPTPYLDTLTHFTVPSGLLGWPIVTLPFGYDANGIPIGLQLVGKPNKEAALLSSAVLVEKLIGFANRGPS